MDDELGPCIEWGGPRNDQGYGVTRTRVHGILMQRVHRIAWAKAHGPIPDELHVLHRCDNPPCYRVDHLYLGTEKDNAEDREGRRRGVNSRKTQCPAGHPYNDDNTYLTRGGARQCRECRKHHKRELYYRQQAKLGKIVKKTVPNPKVVDRANGL